MTDSKRSDQRDEQLKNKQQLSHIFSNISRSIDTLEKVLSEEKIDASILKSVDFRYDLGIHRATSRQKTDLTSSIKNAIVLLNKIHTALGKFLDDTLVKVEAETSSKNKVRNQVTLMITDITKHLSDMDAVPSYKSTPTLNELSKQSSAPKAEVKHEEKEKKEVGVEHEKIEAKEQIFDKETQEELDEVNESLKDTQKKLNDLKTWLITTDLSFDTDKKLESQLRNHIFELTNKKSLEWNPKNAINKAIEILNRIHTALGNFLDDTVAKTKITESLKNSAREQVTRVMTGIEEKLGNMGIFPTYQLDRQSVAPRAARRREEKEEKEEKKPRTIRKYEVPEEKEFKITNIFKDGPLATITQPKFKKLWRDPGKDVFILKRGLMMFGAYISGHEQSTINKISALANTDELKMAGDKEVSSNSKILDEMIKAIDTSQKTAEIALKKHQAEAKKQPVYLKSRYQLYDSLRTLLEKYKDRIANAEETKDAPALQEIKGELNGELKAMLNKIQGIEEPAPPREQKRAP